MVELLMALLLLAITVGGLTALQLGVVRQVTLARRSNDAVHLAQATMDRYRGFAFARIKNLETSDWVIGSNAHGGDLHKVAVDGKSPGPFTVQHLVEDLTGGLKSHYLLTLRVSWLDLAPGTVPDPTRRYGVQSVTISTQVVE